MITTLKKPIFAYKKVTTRVNGFNQPAVAYLMIPAGARMHGTIARGKCRASVAFVLRIRRVEFDYDKHKTVFKEDVKLAVSRHDDTFKYRPLSVVKPRRKFSEDDMDCESGIHFFKSLKKAMNW